MNEAPRQPPPQAALTLRVTSYLGGGLGNQMFQIAAALGYAARASEVSRNGARVVFLPTTDQALSRKLSYTAPGEILSRVPRGRLEVNSESEVFVHLEKDLHYEEIAVPPPVGTRLVVLRGCFQSARYFKPEAAKRAVHQLFQVFPGVEQRLSDRYRWLGDTHRQRVAVHVRRGDYLSLQERHHVLSPAYYARAAMALASRLALVNPDEEIQWVVFSDDIGWCRESLPMRDARHACFVDGNLSDQDSLWLMSMCDHHIIANSTFSWWGAHLRELRDAFVGRATPARQVVVAPRQWFAAKFQANLNTADIYNPGWIVLDESSPPGASTC